MRGNAANRLVLLLLLLLLLVSIATYVYHTQHARMFTTLSSKGKFPPLFVDRRDPDAINMCLDTQGYPEEPSQWWQWACLMERYLVTLDYQCVKVIRRGHWTLCMDAPYNVTPPCLVYSFGINNEWEFDDLMSKEIGCYVHSFDPSMGKKDFQRSPLNRFHDLGLGWQNTDSFQPHRDRYVRNKQLWRMRTLKTIMEELGHHNRTLDVLKMDIELSEWPVFAELLSEGSILTRVRQLMVEWHVFPGNRPPRGDFRDLYHTLARLRQRGFMAFRNNRYGQLRVYNDPKVYRFFVEISYVNVNFGK